MKIKALLAVVVLAAAFMFAGCKRGPVDKTLSVQEIKWYETGSSTEDPVEFNPLEAGDVVFDDGYYRIEVESVSEDMIVLDVDGCLVEPNSDGTINLRGCLQGRRRLITPSLISIPAHAWLRHTADRA